MNLMAVVLWVILLAPLLSIVATTQTLTASKALYLGQITSLVTAGGWFIVTLIGEVQGGPVVANGVIGPVGVVTALLVTTLEEPIDRRSIASRHAAMMVVMFGLVVDAGTGSTVDAFSGLAIATILLVVGVWGSGLERDPVIALGVLGIALVSLVIHTGNIGPLRAGYPLFLGAIFVLIASTADTQPAIATLLPATLSLVIPEAARFVENQKSVTLLIAMFATLMAWRHVWPGKWRGSTNMALVLGLWSLAAVGTGNTSPAWLLGASAVLVLVVMTPATFGAAVPGLVFLVTSLATESSIIGGTFRIGFALLVTGSVAGMITGTSFSTGPIISFVATGVWRIRAARVASAFGVWLIAAPATWGWVTVQPSNGSVISPFTAWAEGSGPAIAVAVIIATTSLLIGSYRFEDLVSFLRLVTDPRVYEPRMLDDKSESHNLRNVTSTT
ncbi:MAG: hypothetical protein ACSLFB_06490 [Acidimicrobiales bacterium]